MCVRELGESNVESLEKCGGSGREPSAELHERRRRVRRRRRGSAGSGLRWVGLRAPSLFPSLPSAPLPPGAASAQARAAPGLLSALYPPPLRKLGIGANCPPLPPRPRNLHFASRRGFFSSSLFAVSASKRYFAWKKEKGKSWERMAVVSSLGSSFIPR